MHEADGQRGDGDMVTRLAVDALLRDHPETSVAALLAAREHSRDHDEAGDARSAQAAELRRRIAAGTRFWLVPADVAASAAAGDDEIPW